MIKENSQPFKNIIIGGAVILSLTQIFIWCIFNLQLFDIPENIPGANVRIYGFLFAVIIIAVYIVFQKRLIITQPQITILRLTVLSTFIGFICELFIQSLRMFILTEDRLPSFLEGLISVTMVDAALAFPIAYQLKTKKTGTLVLFILILGLVCNVLMYFFKK